LRFVTPDVPRTAFIAPVACGAAAGDRLRQPL